MRSKKLTVRYGLLTVMLISLSLTSTSNAWISRGAPTVKTPHIEYAYYDWYYGGIVFALDCDTYGADIRYTWRSGYGEAPTPTSSSYLYEGPLLATCIGQLKATGFKNLHYASGILIVNIR
ncbi:hypothetical protein ACFL5F_06410 [Planctomycetota bacterium]